MNAHYSNLGLLPLLDAQYFVAGIIPTAIIFVVYGIFKHAMLIEQKATSWLQPSGKRGLRYYGLPLVILSLVAMTIYWMKTRELTNASVFLMYTLYVAMTLMLWVGVFGSLPRGRRPKEKTLRNLLARAPWLDVRIVQTLRFRRWNQLIFVVVYGILIIHSYTNIIYPRLPQEFGGSRPRYALVDLLRDELSKDTLEALASADSVSSSSKVVLSKPLAVFYSSTEFMLVKPIEVASKPTFEAMSNTTFELRKSAIKAVTWRATTLTRFGHIPITRYK